MGSLDGVAATRAVWVGAREVVEVAFRPAELSYSALLDVAIARSCDQRVFATSDAQLTTARAKVGERAERYDAARHGAARAAEASDQLHYLGRSPLRFLPLTPGQARQVNAALGARVLGAEVAGTDAAPESFLSPRQRALAARVEAVLVRDPRALEGLDRPADVGALDEYEAALRERLGPEPAQGQRRGPGGA